MSLRGLATNFHQDTTSEARIKRSTYTILSKVFAVVGLARCDGHFSLKGYSRQKREMHSVSSSELAI